MPRATTPKRVPARHVVLQTQPGHYSDGHPLDQVHYLECKIILKPDHFATKQGFIDFAGLVRMVAEEADVKLTTAHLVGQRPQIREVTFYDTPDFRLYNNAFILRRRIMFEDGFPVGDPEIVFKYRHPDMQTAAELDVRPNIPGVYRIKFKAEALPLKDRLGGFRLLYSHNTEFELSQMEEADRTSLVHLVRRFPCLGSLKTTATDRLELVNQMIVEEVMLDFGKLDFGKGVIARTNASLWRSRGEHQHLVGEFSFQAKFDRRVELHKKVRQRCDDFFVALQRVAADWVSLGTTKTGVVYRFKGNPPQSHE